MCVKNDVFHGNDSDHLVRAPAGAARSDGGVRETLRVQLIDAWHKCWPMVLADLEQMGRRDVLRIDHDGWLSARQCVFVALEPESGRLAGHLVFSIEPAASSATAAGSDDRAIGARLDDFAVRPGFDPSEVRELLSDIATRHARSLRCRDLIGFPK